jgi:hypothetical protein
MTTETTEHPRTYRAMFDQGVWWKTKDSGWVRITDMTPEHRANTARFLERRASAYEDAVAWSEFAVFRGAPDGVVDEWLGDMERRSDNPEAWIKSTPLYRALVS